MSRARFLALQGRPWEPPAGCLAIAEEVHRILGIASQFPRVEAGDEWDPALLEGWSEVSSGVAFAPALELGDVAMGLVPSSTGDGQDWHAWTWIGGGVWLTSNRERGSHPAATRVVGRWAAKVLRWTGGPTA